MNTNKHDQPSNICNCANIRRASRAITQFYNDLLAPSGLKVTQYSLLSHIRRLGPLTMNELSQAIHLERTTLVRNLKPLEKLGFIAIAAEKNAQARQITITEKGLKSLEAAFPHWNKAQQVLQELIPENELQIFMGTLQKIESLVP
jgi:DNA-binding MarR family transcriptional regulator